MCNLFWCSHQATPLANEKSGAIKINGTESCVHLLHGRTNRVGQGGLAPPLFRDVKKIQWWKCPLMMQIGCKIWFFSRKFSLMDNSNLYIFARFVPFHLKIFLGRTRRTSSPHKTYAYFIICASYNPNIYQLGTWKR